MTDIEPVDWEARLRAATEKTLAERERRRNERAAFKARRDHGLAQRHARKLARNEQSVAPATEGTEP